MCFISLYRSHDSQLTETFQWQCYNNGSDCNALNIFIVCDRSFKENLLQLLFRNFAAIFVGEETFSRSPSPWFQQDGNISYTGKETCVSSKTFETRQTLFRADHI